MAGGLVKDANENTRFWYNLLNSHLTSSSSKIMITEEETTAASSPVFYKSDLTQPRVPLGSCTSRRWGRCRDTWTLRGWLQVSPPLLMSLCPASPFLEDNFYTKVTFWFRISLAVHKTVVFWTLFEGTVGSMQHFLNFVWKYVLKSKFGIAVQFGFIN